MLRSEAKRRSRQRLLDAALAILDESDVAGLTTTSVTRRAGLAQSSFYVHFTSVDDLLRQLVDEVWEERRSTARRSREAAAGAPTDEFLRTRFRALVDGMIAHPAIFRLVMRSRLDPPSAISDDARAQQHKSRRNLADALEAMGAPVDTDSDRRKVEMIAAGLIAVNDTLALGHLEGAYPDLDEVLDVLVLFHKQVQKAVVRRPAPPGTAAPGPGATDAPGAETP